MADTNDPKVYRRGLKLYCRKDFRFSGRDFKSSDIFPARKLAVSDNKVQQLINANFLTQNASPQTTVSEVKVKSRGGGWFDVFKGGMKVNSSPVRKPEAEDLAGKKISGRTK